MSAATADLTTPQRGADPRLSHLEFPVAAATKIFGKTLVAVNAAGNAVPASADSALKVVGLSQSGVDNSAGVAGAKRVLVVQGVHRLVNSAATDALTVADLGQPCYAVDDNKVARTSGSGERPVAGRVVEVDAFGVWVESALTLGVPPGPAGDTDTLLVSASTFTGKQYFAAALDTAGKAALPSVAGQACFGIMQSAPIIGAVGPVRTKGNSKAVLGGTVTMGDRLTTDAAGKLITGHGADRVVAIARESGIALDIIDVEVCAPAAAFAEHGPLGFTQHRNLADLADAALAFAFTPGFVGRVKKISVIPSKAATTAAKASTLTGRIGATAMTGGVAALTTTTMATAGVPQEATAITAGNLFGATDSINALISATTAFVEGEADITFELA